MTNIYDKSIGKNAYYVINDVLRKAKIVSYEFHDGLQMIVFTLKSDYGNILRLSTNEIKFIVY